jgi:hypothetical protein
MRFSALSWLSANSLVQRINHYKSGLPESQGDLGPEIPGFWFVLYGLLPKSI